MSDQFPDKREQDPWGCANCPAKAAFRPTDTNGQPFMLGRFGKQYGRNDMRWAARGVGLRDPHVRARFWWASVTV